MCWAYSRGSSLHTPFSTLTKTTFHLKLHLKALIPKHDFFRSDLTCAYWCSAGSHPPVYEGDLGQQLAYQLLLLLLGQVGLAREGFTKEKERKKKRKKQKIYAENGRGWKRIVGPGWWRGGGGSRSRPPAPPAAGPGSTSAADAASHLERGGEEERRRDSE